MSFGCVHIRAPPWNAEILRNRKDDMRGGAWDSNPSYSVIPYPKRDGGKLSAATYAGISERGQYGPSDSGSFPHMSSRGAFNVRTAGPFTASSSP